MSIGLTARELAQMRADIEDLFPDTCDILSVAYTSDSEGGFAEAWGEWTMAERREVVRLLFERVRLDVGGGVLEVKPREEFRELFAARRDYVHTKCGTTPDRSGTSFLTSGWFDHVADLRAG